ncbi:hypothetical protein M409DRAFT_23451 [Zasmidium cellare ATCC 36951]|uniref:NmrA-like domain-containing protein n=1 Tax=Zasmidium cellare ATCC 36951 TaxID=1080233 RepID=A0A6A6CKL6_ZASCE|nr:uncharacterized protein M409DRAFT_23451 [Zasmidium cellare ATCC 36951]KAF2166259.1 hypothetical protein M409DRAFT_23451 [Zasmidium cellare ATCC 36951]
MAYKRIGVVGSTGRLGREVTRALVDEGFDVVPFSRQDTTVAGIRTQTITSFVGFDVIISTVGHAAIPDQIHLIDQAKREGVKCFVPAEFGMDHRFSNEKLSDPKRRVAEALQRAEFPDGWTSIAAGFFDAVLPALVSIDKTNATITLRGTGKKQYPFVRRYDLGRALAETFREPQKYKDQWLLVAGDWKSLHEIASLVQARSSTPLEVHRLPTEPRTMFLHIFETEGGNVFERENQSSFPFELAKVEDFVGESLEIP